MSLDVGAVLRDGASRTARPNALLLMAGFVVVGLASLVGNHSYVAWAMGEGLVQEELLEFAGPDPHPLAVEMPVLAALGLWTLTVFGAEGLRIVAIRTLVSDHTDAIPRSFVTRRIGWVVLNGFVGTLVVTVLVAIGTLLLVLPGIFLALAFFFVRQEIAVEDANFVDAMTDSWELTAGDRLELAVLGIVWITLWLTVLVVTAGVRAALASAPAVAAIVPVFLGAPVTVFGVAVGARAYVRLKEAEATDRDGEGTGDGGDGGSDEGADGDADDEEEWPDPPGVDI